LVVLFNFRLRSAHRIVVWRMSHPFQPKYATAESAQIVRRSFNLKGDLKHQPCSSLSTLVPGLLKATWAFLRQYMSSFDSAIFTMRDFVPPDFPIAAVDIIPPAIDPLSPKNMPLTDATARQVLRASTWIGRSSHRSLVSIPGKTHWG
jgi:hypothetical protein